MDLECENSALESTGDNDPVCATNPLIEGDVKIESNGSALHDDGHSYGSESNGYPFPPVGSVEIKEDANMLNSEAHDAYTVVSSEGKGTESDQYIGNSPSASGTKGKFLRKWRRIRREITKDGSSNRDVTKILKRGSANLVNSLDAVAGMKQKSEGSVSSTNAFVNNPVAADSFSNAESSSIYKVVGISTFSVGTDSDNSEDRSSKSSTAASMPKTRYDQSRALGHSRDKHKVKHMAKKNSGNSTPQRVEQGATQLDAGKKAWGAAVNIDKENSLSSLESDSRNYCSLFMQGSSYAFDNGHSEKLIGSDGEHSDDEPAEEQQSVEGPHAGPNGSVGEDEETSQVVGALSWQISDTTKNHKPSGHEDPLIDCVQMLQSVQDALEQEIQKFSDLGKDLRPLEDDLIRDAKLMGQVPKIEAMKKQLEEAMATLKEKDSRITELESTINDMKSSSGDLGKSVEARQKKYNEIEAEIEFLFKQKTEAEINYLATSDKSIITSKQAQELSKTDDLGSKSALLNDNAEETESSKTEIKKMQNRVTKFCVCFFIQLILFIFVLDFFAMQFLPKSEVVMPT